MNNLHSTLPLTFDCIYWPDSRSDDVLVLLYYHAIHYVHMQHKGGPPACIFLLYSMSWIHLRNTESFRTHHISSWLAHCHRFLQNRVVSFPMHAGPLSDRATVVMDRGLSRDGGHPGLRPWQSFGFLLRREGSRCIDGIKWNSYSQPWGEMEAVIRGIYEIYISPVAISNCSQPKQSDVTVENHLVSWLTCCWEYLRRGFFFLTAEVLAVSFHLASQMRYTVNVFSQVCTIRPDFPLEQGWTTTWNPLWDSKS